MKRIGKRFVKLLCILLAAGGCLLAAAGIVVGFQGYAMYRSAVGELPIEEGLRQAQSMEDFIPFEELPEIYVDAVTAAEDHRFWTHRGIDLIAIARALFDDLRTRSFAEGGSTITQQLMKNQYFSQEKTLERKAAEIFAALEAEKRCGKREIFEWYVNTIYFGSGYYGIREAARGYFGKEPSQLEDGEALMLAGLPNAPSVYSPDADPELALERMEQVAECMVRRGMLSEERAEELTVEMTEELTKDLGDFVTEKKLEIG